LRDSHEILEVAHLSLWKKVESTTLRGDTVSRMSSINERGSHLVQKILQSDLTETILDNRRFSASVQPWQPPSGIS
jgi:hypothetical protein